MIRTLHLITYRIHELQFVVDTYEENDPDHPQKKECSDEIKNWKTLKHYLRTSPFPAKTEEYIINCYSALIQTYAELLKSQKKDLKLMKEGNYEWDKNSQFEISPPLILRKLSPEEMEFETVQNIQTTKEYLSMINESLHELKTTHEFDLDEIEIPKN